MESENGKEEEQSLSKRLGLALAKVFLQGSRLFQMVGSLLVRVVGNFKFRYASIEYSKIVR